MEVIHIGHRSEAGWTSLAHGVHVRAEVSDDLATSLLARQMVLPFWASFTGLTAARLRGWWLPPLPAQLPLFVASGRSDRIDRPGLRVCRHDVLQTWEMVDNVRTSLPAETVLACSRELGLLDVVLIGDAALHSGQVTRDQLVEVSRLRRRGSPLLRRAIPLMDGRSESIYETLLRVLHVVCDVRVESQHAVICVGNGGSSWLATSAGVTRRRTFCMRLPEFSAMLTGASAGSMTQVASRRGTPFCAIHSSPPPGDTAFSGGSACSKKTRTNH
jgi:hypothetical protein